MPVAVCALHNYDIVNLPTPPHLLGLCVHTADAKLLFYTAFEGLPAWAEGIVKLRTEHVSVDSPSCYRGLKSRSS